MLQFKGKNSVHYLAHILALEYTHYLIYLLLICVPNEVTIHLPITVAVDRYAKLRGKLRNLGCIGQNDLIPELVILVGPG